MIGNCAWCAGMFACSAITDCIGSSFKQQVRLSYFIFDTFVVGIGLLVVFGISKIAGQDFLTHISAFSECSSANTGFSCLAVYSIYRLSLALVALHVFILLFLLMRNGCSKVFNEQVWLFKILMIVCMFIGFFFVGNSFFQIYSTIAMVFSLIFLLFQVVMMIDLFYLWGVGWIKSYDEGRNIFMYLLIIFTLGMYAGAGYFIVNTYSAFGGCGTGILVASVNVLFVVVATALIFIGTNPDGSLLCSAAVSLIASYLTWSGLTHMADSCNTLGASYTVAIANLVIGVVIIIISLTYVSVGSSEVTSGQMSAGGVNVARAVLAEAKDENDDKRRRLDEENQRRGSKDDLSVYQTNSYINFHIILIFASFYISMLLTDWGSPAMAGNSLLDMEKGNSSMWIKIGTAWVAIGVYVWSLVAPRIFPDRDFS